MALALSTSSASRQLAGVVAVFNPAVEVSYTEDASAAPSLGGHSGSAIELASQLVPDSPTISKQLSDLLAADAAAAHAQLNTLLAKSTFVLGPQAGKPSIIDALLFGHVHDVIAAQNNEQRSASNHVTRWFQHLQATAATKVPLLPTIDVSQEYLAPKKDAAKAADGGGAAAPAGGKGGKAGGKGGRQPAAKAVEASDASKAKLLVGKMLSVEKHPNADSLYVERIDLGEGEPRTIVSGLVNWYTPDQLLGRLVVVVANLAPADLKGVSSAGLVLCASNADKSVVEVLEPPAGTAVGERVQIVGEEPAEEPELNKKIFQRFLKPLQTNDAKVATWKGQVLQTSAGAVTVPTLAGAAIK